jgi:hypothetical protein
MIIVSVGSVILVCELGSGLGLNRSSIGPQSRGVSVCKSLVRPPVGKVGKVGGPILHVACLFFVIFYQHFCNFCNIILISQRPLLESVARLDKFCGRTLWREKLTHNSNQDTPRAEPHTHTHSLKHITATATHNQVRLSPHAANIAAPCPLTRPAWSVWGLPELDLTISVPGVAWLRHPALCAKRE